MLLAVAAESGSWAHLVALLIAAGLAVLAVGTHQWWMEYRDPSPPPLDGPDTGVTPGETWVSDDDDTDPDTDDDTLPEGRYRLPDGSILVRRWHPPDDTDVDLDLDDDPGETREEMAARLVADRAGYADAVREIMGAHDVSEATAKRAIRDARERLGE
jgi:hypothetical protein